MKQRHPDLIAWTLLLLAGVVIVTMTESNIGLSFILVASLLFVWSYFHRRRERSESMDLPNGRSHRAR
jgi:hypothetical protein